MPSPNPIELLFNGMGKLGPGDDAVTLEVLRRLPSRRFDTVVDAGCGTGRQTLVLARELRTVVHALDTHEPFLTDLARRAGAAGIGHLVQTHCMNMLEIRGVYHDIDLLWSEGAAYNIGFPRALAVWAPAMRQGGCLVASELSWLTDRIPDPVREFFRAGYPAMQSSADNIAAAENTGYTVLFTRTLPANAWIDGYYDVLGPRARALLNHPDESVREFALETVREIEIFGQSEDSFGYVFYALRRE